jgi:hypothetical protein
VIDLDALKARTTIGEVLSAHGQSAARRGPCPLHGGDNRSAFSHDDRRWACWTHCGAGDVVDLVERLRGVDFRAAVAWLEGFTGLRARPLPGRRTFPNLAPHARQAWLDDIEERWQNWCELDPSWPYLDDLEAEWHEAQRMPGKHSIRPLLDRIVQILGGAE